MPAIPSREVESRNRRGGLYLWNARLAKAFLFPLQICEVTIRIAINEALATVYGADWILAPAFGLNEHSRASHDRALQRLIRRAQRLALPPPVSDDLVAALTFDFWSNLLRDDYDDVWTIPVLAVAFPNLPHGQGRRQVQKMAAEVNELRNRIAHHEPIHDRQNHGAKFAIVLDLIGLRSGQVREFTRRHSTVMAVVRVPLTRQSRFPGRPLAQMNLRPPPVIHHTDTIDVVIVALRAARPDLALIPDAARAPPYAALTIATVSALIVDRARTAGGLVDLTELTAGEVVVAYPLAIDEIDLRASGGDALSMFFPSDPAAPKPSALLVRSANGDLSGALVRPDFRL
ncbi:hypothetical protein [Polymorphobacter megasporae]|uniref:hypothetical protein n=1 Tax=Glacieibacterium megasporae TaxID=2835787 RepID=UPI001C1E1784|nr:hypothetical protein [Polymorphobacter megasporae]UAJ10501.1 hypothetical protein KTC28_01680 [Polymorphobacter megasporae]